MNDDRFTTLKRILAAAIELDPADRASYLDDACRSDAELRAQVDAKLAHVDRDPTVLGTGGAGVLLPSGDPETVGGYRILHRIGVGGMGTVYAAEQQSPRRTVALKVIRPGLLAPRLARRFQQEAQLLGRLQHPGIAQILEAGTFDSGAGPQPFFAMELIDGEPLQTYCERSAPDHRARLELMARICDAVQHAHQRGVIHRDLKPANILVVKSEEGVQPKILDFGIARATDADVQQTTWHTETGQLIGTLPYMSPEQAAGGSDDLDARSDIYSLGVITYELLAGKLPYEVPNSVLEAIQTIREEEPSSLRTVNRSFRGDVETIVGKALEKERDRRYASAAAMAHDIRCHLRDEPITARRPSRAYRIRKFTRRHRALVGATAAVFGVLVAGAVTSLTFALRARERAEEATAISDFLREDLLSAVAPSVAAGRGRDVAMKDVLDAAAERIDEAVAPGGRFADRPLVEAMIRRTLGDTYRQLGELDVAEPHLERALSLRREELDAEHELLAESEMDLAILRFRQGRLEEAESRYRQILDRHRRVFGPDHAVTLGALNNLVLAVREAGRYAEAESLGVDLLERCRRALRGDHPTTVNAVNALAISYDKLGRLDEAEPLYREALSARERTDGVDAPETLYIRGNLAIVCIKRGRLDEADSLYAATLEAEERVLGPAHSFTIDTLVNMAVLRGRQGRLQEKLELELDALDRCRETLGEENHRTLRVLNNLGSTYTNLGRLDDAAPVVLKTLETRRRVLGDDHPETFLSLSNYCELLILQRRFEEARVETHAYRDRSAEVFGEEHPETKYATELLVRLYEQAGDAEQATHWKAKLEG